MNFQHPEVIYKSYEKKSFDFFCFGTLHPMTKYLDWSNLVAQRQNQPFPPPFSTIFVPENLLIGTFQLSPAASSTF